MAQWDATFLIPDRGAKRAPQPLAPAPKERAVGVPTSRQYLGAVDHKTLVRTFSANELAFACVSIRAECAGDPTLQVEQRQSDGTYTPIPGHPLRRLFVRPNDHQDSAAFMRAAVASFDICGVFYAERLVSAAGGLVGLNPLNPASVTPMYSDNQLIYRWQESGAQKIDFRPDELLIRRGDWTRPARMAVALSTTDGDSAQTDYVRSFFNNGGVPSGRIKVKGTISQEVADGIRNRWRAMFTRYSRQHDVAVFDDNGDYEKIGSNLDELESAIVRGVSESRICMTFGVPPLVVYSYFGLSRSTYSNMREAMRGFWDLTMSPLLKEWRAFFLWSLLSEFESQEAILSEQIRLGWDMSLVSALQEDTDAKEKRARDNLTAGAIQVNEARAALGVPPDPAGAYYLRTKSMTAQKFGEFPEAAPAPAPAPAPVGDTMPNLTPAKHRTL